MTDLDPKLTFDSFVVGPANRLASAAARRAADSPGTSYNPLFLYSASGLGKSHILVAIANHSLKTDPDRHVEYMALEGYLEDLTAALKSGSRDDFKDRYEGLDILLLDDVQFLTGQNEAQEMLLRTLDHLSAGGSQIVLASDRPPAEIDGLDARLLSRFSGGLIVDIGVPEYETRVAIIRRKAEEGGQTLAPGVADALARYPVKNIRELGGALNKVFATQDLEERQISPRRSRGFSAGVTRQPRSDAHDEFGLFLEDLTGAVAKSVAAQEEPWRKAIRETVNAAEREGFSTQRLRAHLGKGEPAGWEKIVEKFRADVQRLRDIDDELDRLGNPWPEAAQGLLKDPGSPGRGRGPARLGARAPAPVSQARRRAGPGGARGLLEDGAQGGAAARGGRETRSTTPCTSGRIPRSAARTLLGAAGRTFQAAADPEARMAVTSVREFAEDFIRALGEGVAGAWRERWWTVDLLLVHGVEALSETERAQDEFFHLFEALKRRGARVLLAADRSPTGHHQDRRAAPLPLRGRPGAGGGCGRGLGRARVGGGGGARRGRGAVGRRASVPRAGTGRSPVGRDARSGSGPGSSWTPPGGRRGRRRRRGHRGARGGSGSLRRHVGSGWFPSAENVVLHWPQVEELLQEEFE